MTIIKSGCILLQASAKNAEESIEAAGKVLVREGYITRQYIEGMIHNYHQNGPYFAIAPGFAMPHARPEDGVLKSGAALITLKEPVSFGSPNDPVKVIMPLATSSNETHLEYMAKIAELLSRKNVIEEIYQCKEPKELEKILLTLI